MKAPTDFFICLPDPKAWGFGVPSGAIGLPHGLDEPNCSLPTAFGFIYPYEFAAPCKHGVTCLNLDEGCSCKCPDSSACNAMQTYLEDEYFGEDEDGLFPGGWESACTGYPWKWDQYAYGVGSYVGTSCEWNMPPPMPGDIPGALYKAIEDVKCKWGTCTVPEHRLDEILASPGLVFGSSAVTIGRDVIEIIACEHICKELGLHVGDRIVDVGLNRLSPTDPIAWLRSYDELLERGTQATIHTERRVWTLKIAVRN